MVGGAPVLAVVAVVVPSSVDAPSAVPPLESPQPVSANVAAMSASFCSLLMIARA